MPHPARKFFDSVALPNHGADVFARLEEAAQDADTSAYSRNMPTLAQRRDSDYTMGHAVLHGIPVRIESPRNTYREKTDKGGKVWRSRMAAHYGDFPGTCGNDGDPVDGFFGPFPESPFVWVINQRLLYSETLDEHKAMLGFVSEQQARAAYQDSYDRGWTGLMSIVPATVNQFKWWLKSGDKSRPFSADQLPTEGTSIMDKVLWNKDAEPATMTLHQLMYAMRVNDGKDGLLLDGVTMAELMADPEVESVLAYDALVVEVNRMTVKMEMLKKVMEAAGGTVKPTEVTISDPVKARGVLQVMVLFQMSDGQTIAIWFHNPDTTPSKLTPMDELISWKWMLNKKDVTIVVAPERGTELNIREVARRVMRLVERNTDAYQKANAKAGERAAESAALDGEIVTLEGELTGLQRQIEVAKVEKEDAGAAVSRKITAVFAEQARVFDLLDKEKAFGAGADTVKLEALMNQYDDLADEIRTLRGEAVEGRSSWATWNKLRAGDAARAGENGADWRGGAPSFTTEKGAMVVRDWSSGDALPEFSGIAYDYMAKAFVLTEMENGERTINYLTAATYAQALIETEALKLKLSMPADSNIGRKFGEGDAQRTVLGIFSKPGDPLDGAYRISGLKLPDGSGFTYAPDTLVMPNDLEAYIAASVAEQAPEAESRRMPAPFEPQSTEFTVGGKEWRITVKRYWLVPATEAQNPDQLSWSAERKNGAFFEHVPSDDIPQAAAKKASEFFNRVAAGQVSDLLSPEADPEAWRAVANAFGKTKPNYVGTRSQDAAPGMAEAKLGTWAFTNVGTDAAPAFNAIFPTGEGKYSSGDTHPTPDDAYESMTKRGRWIMIQSELSPSAEEPFKLADAQDPVATVDAAYQFADASTAFKENVAESVGEAEYSTFATAKAMDLKAKELGLKISWDVGNAVLDSAGDAKEDDEEDDDFDVADEWDATPDTDDEGKEVGAVMDGDFKGHPFRGNQHKQTSHESGAAVGSSMRAKHAERNGDTKGASKAHASAHYSHKAASVSATGKAKSYHKKMAKFHGERAGLSVLDSVFDDAGESYEMVIGQIGKDAEVMARAMIGGDGKAMVYLGTTGTERVKSVSGNPAMWSDDDAADLVGYLAASVSATEVPAVAAAAPATGDTDVSRLNEVERAAPKGAITSDDPAAIEKLEAKLTALQTRQEFMKKANKFIKTGNDAGLLAMGMSQGQIDTLKKPDFAGRIGFADYLLSNNNGVIGTTRKRLESMMKTSLREQQEADAKSTPEPIVTEVNVMDQYIKIAADSLEQLRKVDVDRVLGSVRSDNVDGVTRESLAEYIKDGRPDLAGEVDDVLAELSAPAVAAEVPAEVPAAVANPAKDADTAYLQSLADGTTNMFADDIYSRLEPMYATYEHDAEMMALFARAAEAYGDSAVKAAKAALATA